MHPIAGEPWEGSKYPPFAHERGVIHGRQDKGGRLSTTAETVSATRRGSQEPIGPGWRFDATDCSEYSACTKAVAAEQGEEVGQERDEAPEPSHLRGDNESQEKGEKARSEEGRMEQHSIEHVPSAEVPETQDEREALEGFLFDVRRSARYHERRCAFFTVLHRLTNLTAILLAGVVLVELSASHPSPLWIRLLAVTGGLLSACDLVVGFGPRADAHRQFKRHFVVLEQKVIKGAPFAKLTDERLNIETEEPPIYRALDVLCHNEVCRAMGKDKCEFRNVPPYARWTAQILHWNDHEFPALEPRSAESTEEAE